MRRTSLPHFFFVLAALVVLGSDNFGEPLPSKSKSPIKAGVWNVVRVVDGDTLIVGNKADRFQLYRVRLIGVDTPEVVHPTKPVEPFGPEASAFTKQKIAEAGNKVRIAFDGDQLDRYERILAMVYLKMPDGKEIWLNEVLVREGLATVELQYRYSDSAKRALVAAETEAKNAKRNMWEEKLTVSP